MEHVQQQSGRQAAAPQALTVVIASFLPMIAVVSMFPAVPSIVSPPVVTLAQGATGSMQATLAPRGWRR